MKPGFLAFFTWLGTEGRGCLCEIDLDLEQVFMRRFQAGIFFLMPSDGFVMECRGHVYGFPKGTTERDVNLMMAQSLRENRNLIYDRIKTNEILTDPDADY